MKFSNGPLKFLGFVFVLCLVAIGTLAGAYAFGNPIDRFMQGRSDVVIHSIQREEQVVLLSVEMQTVESDSDNQKVFTVVIPGTSRAMLVQYSFKAKFGIEGKDVKVEETGDNSYLVTIPEFISIGQENVNVKQIKEENGVLSWITPEIDENRLLNKALRKELQEEQIRKHEDALRDQAATFYKGIVKGIDPDAILEFKYS